MGWGRTLLLGDIGNRLDIGDVEQEVARIKRQMHSKDCLDMAQEEQLTLLTAELSEIKLYIKHLVWLLEDKQLVSREEVEKMVKDVEQ
ncbi:MAG: hypothetical protein AAF483_02650 [Planctomycetota bacterium]